MTPAAVYLKLTPDPVLAFHHRGSERDGPSAVVLVAPFGWEDVASYRVRFDWAERLSARGHHVLRLDLPGTGDSAGSPATPGRLGAWADAVAASAAWLRTTAGTARVTAVGLGTGGVVAWLAAQRGGVDDLALWNVPARPKALLRELQAFAAFASGHHPVDPSLAPVDLPEDAMVVAGHLLEPGTRAALAALDLRTELLPLAARRRILLLGRDGADPDVGLADVLRGSGAEVTTADGPGWGDMTASPEEASFPEQTAATLDGWLARAPAATGSAYPVARLPSGTQALTLGEVVERPWRHGDSFGILASPAAGGEAALGVILLNAGAIRRSGPHRMWTEIARDWAARGVPVLRLDLPGIGDAGGTRAYETMEDLYAGALQDQLEAAIAAAAAEGMAASFVAGGLFTGGHWAFQLLQRELPLQAAFLLNPATLLRDDVSTGSAPPAIARPSRPPREPATWKRLLRRELSRDEAVMHLLRLLTTSGPAQERERPFHLATTRTHAALDRLRDADKRVHVLLGREQPMAARLEAEEVTTQLDRWPNLAYERLPTTDPEFSAPPLQRHVRRRLDAVLEAELARADRLVPFA